MMAAAGYPQYLVAQYGGWTENSQSLKIYTKLSEKTLIAVSKHMADMAKVNVSSMFINDANIRVKNQTNFRGGETQLDNSIVEA